MSKISSPTEACILINRLFLNIFGLFLSGDNETIILNTREVGKVKIEEDKVIISARYNGAVLKASYTIPHSGLETIYNHENTLFGKHNVIIEFDALSDNRKYNGSLFLVYDINNNRSIISESDTSYDVDDEQSIKCSLGAYVDITDAIGNFKLSMHESNKFFELNFEDNDYEEQGIERSNEQIIMSPTLIDVTDDDIYIKHAFSIVKDGYESKVFPSSHNPNIVRAMFIDKENGESRVSKSLSVPLAKFKPSEDDGPLTPEEIEHRKRELEIIQRRDLMENIDDIYYRIGIFKNIMIIGGINVFNNLVSTCYYDLSDEEMINLIGVGKREMFYQEANDFTEACCGRQYIK